jgi:hypothetical protein
MEAKVDTPTPAERAARAERAWTLAKLRKDSRLANVALLEYRDARREMRGRPRTRIDGREASKLLDAYRPDWA